VRLCRESERPLPLRTVLAGPSPQRATGKPEWQKPVTKDRNEIMSWLGANDKAAAYVREQSSMARPVRDRLLNRRRQRTLARLVGRDDPGRGYLSRGLGRRLASSQHERTRREDRRPKFYEISDNIRSRQSAERSLCQYVAGQA
jgi:hypothetical protein